MYVDELLETGESRERSYEYPSEPAPTRLIGLRSREKYADAVGGGGARGRRS